MKEIVKAFDGHDVRSVVIKGEPWFVAADVCEALDISDASQAVSRLEDDEKLMRTLHVSGQGRDIWTINESGLYSLVIRSNKPEAKAFRKWITSEVLPSIRKTGRYSVDPADRKKSARLRLDLTGVWAAHGADKPHHFINLTRAEYKALGYGNGMGVKKEQMDAEELARLAVFEAVEAYKLKRNAGITGYYQLADSIAETGKHIPMLIDDIIARRITA